ncbi:MAG: hypothetical protein KC636_13200, partial [Myxococcales bacterium]|nr:hypothetical protein [Myxococcales bacterium]
MGDDTDGAREGEIDEVDRAEEARSSTPATVMIYVTPSALSGLTPDGQRVIHGASEGGVAWLLDQIKRRIRLREGGGTTYVVEYAQAPVFREQLLRVQPGQRFVLGDGGDAWTTRDEPLSDLAGFIVWTRRNYPGDRFSLLLLGDVLDVGGCSVEAPASASRALVSLLGLTSPGRGLSSGLSDKGSRP